MKREIVTPGAAFALAFAVLLSGCAGLGPERPPEEVVQKRAQAWADALLKGNLEGAYRYTSPTYRSYASAGAYHARVEGTSRWEVAEVRAVECPTEQLCKVTFMLEYPGYQGQGTIRRPRTYKWVRSEGRWWIYVAP